MPLPWDQASFKSVIDTMGALVVFLDRFGGIVEFNHACERLTGYTEGEVKGRVFGDFLLLPEERDAVMAVFGRLQAGDFPNQFENHWVSKTGAARLITWANTALVDASGQVEIIVGTGIDITEQRQSQERFLTTLADITRLSLQIPNVETMLQTLADHITKIIDADDCYITLWDAESRQSIPIAASADLRQVFTETG